MPFECEFCNKSFTNKGNMVKHQKTAKYCINIQNDNDPNTSIDHISYDCKYCDKKFTQQAHLTRHLPCCIEKFKSRIREQDDKIKDLENKLNQAEEKIKTIEMETEIRILRQYSQDNQSTLHEIAKQPRNQVNNNQKVLITSSIDLSQEKMKDMIDNSFNADYMIQGQKGVAKFAYDTMLKDEEGKLKYICTDPSRQIFQYKNCEGEIQKDVKAKKLTKALLDGELKSASHKIASDKMKDNSDDFLEYSTYYLDIKELEDDNSDFSKELSTLVI